jgi:hypothetical protein
VNDYTISGDHVILRSEWTTPVNSSRISVSSGFNVTRYGTAPGITEWPECLQEYVWEGFDGITAGDEVNIWLNTSDNGDSAFDVWTWTDYDSDCEIDEAELGSATLFSVDVYVAGIPESVSFISNTSGAIAIRLCAWYYTHSENMTYELQVDAGVYFEIDNTPDNPSEVVFDTYNLLRNIIVNITLYGWNSTDVMMVEFCNITVQNYFEPMISDLIAEEIESYVWSFSWSCYDINANDMNYFSVWISGDSGATYQMLAMNLSQSYWVWDSIGYSMLNYLVRIRAYSLDLTFGNRCSTSNPPHSYWPGDYSDATLTLDAGDVHSWPPGYGSVSIDSPADLSYQEGTSGNTIVWRPTPLVIGWNYLVYDVLCNGTQWTSGEFYTSDESIEVNIDGLSHGRYIFELRIGGTASDSVTVTVLPSEMDSLMGQIIHYGAIGVSIGSSLVIITVIVLTIRLRRDYYSKIPS